MDSEQLSSGQGLLALEAGRLAAAGKSVAEILEALEEAKKRVSTSFIVDSAEYLTRDNHISPAVATITGALMIHPVITMKKGKLAVKGICFGSREKVWEQYVNSTLRLLSMIDRRLLFITHAGLSQKELELIRGMVEQKIPFENVYYQEASPSIAANCGPGTFGLLFLKT